MLFFALFDLQPVASGLHSANPQMKIKKISWTGLYSKQRWREKKHHTKKQVHRAVLKAEVARSGKLTEAQILISTLYNDYVQYRDARALAVENFFVWQVAVKIRHPNVEEETYVDIDLIFAFINCLGEGCCGHFTIPFKKEEFHEVRVCVCERCVCEVYIYIYTYA